jgi:hypothetical protein
MAWALTATVSCAISDRAASNCQTHCVPGCPGLRASAAYAASLAVRRIPITVDTSTCARRVGLRHLASGDLQRRSPKFLTRISAAKSDANQVELLVPFRYFGVDPGSVLASPGDFDPQAGSRLPRMYEQAWSRSLVRLPTNGIKLREGYPAHQP